MGLQRAGCGLRGDSHGGPGAPAAAARARFWTRTPLAVLAPPTPASPPTHTQVQIIRIQLRVPEYGWTTQKVFHLLNLLVCGLRAAVFALRAQVQRLPSTLIQAALLDLPGEGLGAGGEARGGRRGTGAAHVRASLPPVPR